MTNEVVSVSELLQSSPRQARQWEQFRHPTFHCNSSPQVRVLSLMVHDFRPLPVQWRVVEKPMPRPPVWGPFLAWSGVLAARYFSRAKLRRCVFTSLSRLSEMLKVRGNRLCHGLSFVPFLAHSFHCLLCGAWLPQNLEYMWLVSPYLLTLVLFVLSVRKVWGGLKYAWQPLGSLSCLFLGVGFLILDSCITWIIGNVPLLFVSVVLRVGSSRKFPLQQPPFLSFSLLSFLFLLQ